MFSRLSVSLCVCVSMWNAFFVKNMCLSCHMKSNLQDPGCFGKNNSNSSRDWASPETWELTCLLLLPYQDQRNLLSSLIDPGLYCRKCSCSDKVNPFWKFSCSFLMCLYRKKHQDLYFPWFPLVKALKGTLETACYGTVSFILEAFTFFETFMYLGKKKNSLLSWQIHFDGLSAHEVTKWQPEQAQGRNMWQKEV